MKIVKDKKQFNSFSIEGLTAGKLMALVHVLEKANDAGMLLPLQKEIFNTLKNQEKVFLDK